MGMERLLIDPIVEADDASAMRAVSAVPDTVPASVPPAGALLQRPEMPPENGWDEV